MWAEDRWNDLLLGTRRVRTGGWCAGLYVSLLLVGIPSGRRDVYSSQCGVDYTCGLKTDGTVFCWGFDVYGQVDGKSNTTSPYYSSGSPPGGGAFTQVSAGGNTTCGIRPDGTALCWGDDQNGEVNGTPITSGLGYATGKPPGGGTFIQVSAGDSHTCGIKANGTSFCWGYDAYGETNGSPVATFPHYGQGSAPGGGTFLQISASGSHTCGIKSNGATFCWGDDHVRADERNSIDSLAGVLRTGRTSRRGNVYPGIGECRWKPYL